MVADRGELTLRWSDMLNVKPVENEPADNAVMRLLKRKGLPVKGVVVLRADEDNFDFWQAENYRDGTIMIKWRRKEGRAPQ